MFTTGSKFLLGATALSGVLAALYGVMQGGTLGTLGLVGATAGLALLAGINAFVRDSNVSAMDHDAFAVSAAAQAPTRPSLWPLLAALGAVTVTLGLVTTKAFFMIGVVLLIAAAIEWLVQGWSERATADRHANSEARLTLIDPLEIPVASAIFGGGIAFAFSRVMLGLPTKSATVVAFAVVAALVLAVGSLVGINKGASKETLTGLFSIAAVALVAGGAFAGINGQREIHKHETPSDLAAIDECGEHETHADANASQSLASKSNIAADVWFDGSQLTFDVPGFDGDFAALTLPRSNPSNIWFHNESDGPARLVLELFPDENANDPGPPRVCTALAEEGGTQFLTIALGRSTGSVQAGGGAGYAFTVPGSDASLEVIVP